MYDVFLLRRYKPLVKLLLTPPLPTFRRRQANSLSRLLPMTVDEAVKVLARTPMKPCQLDHVLFVAGRSSQSSVSASMTAAKC